MKKRQKEKADGGINSKQRQQLASAIRQVWCWSHARKVCIARATDDKGFGRCEICKKKVPKLFADHIEACGDLLAKGYLSRMFRPSTALQALCRKCHDAKTRLERKRNAEGF
jgi:hypothetical protein